MIYVTINSKKKGNNIMKCLKNAINLFKKSTKKLVAVMLVTTVIGGIVFSSPSIHSSAASKGKLTVAVSNKTLTFKWSGTSGKRYYLGRTNTAFSDNEDIDGMGSTTKTSFTYTIPKNDRDWNWKWCVYVKKGNDLYPVTNKVTVYHKPSSFNPKIKSTVKNGKINLTWNKVAGNGYKVYKVINGRWTVVKTIKGNTNTSTSFKATKGTHKYFIKPFVYTEKGIKIGGKSASKVPYSNNTGYKIKIVVK